MGHYRARDLLLAPSLISLTRLPLAIAFVVVAPEPIPSVVVMLVAAVTDMLDGVVARRFNLATPTGAVVDGALDKAFTAVVVGTLIAEHELSILEACLIFVREVAELPLVVWWALHHRQRRARAEDPRANYAGKLATVLQFVCIVLLLGHSAWFPASLLITAGAGAIAAVLYWVREVGAARGRRLVDS